MDDGVSMAGSEVTVIGPGGIRAAVNKLAPLFEQATGHKVTGTFGSGGGTRQQVVNGEHFDVPIVQPPVDAVEASGHVDVTTKTLLASVWVGIAVRSGEAKPDISSGEALKKLLLSARKISYPNAARGAGAAVSFDATLNKLGIFEEVKAKTIVAQTGANAMELLARKEVDFGLTYISEILPEPGVEVVGPLPGDVSEPTALIAYLSSHAKDPAAARALLDFLSSAQADAVYKAGGMVPGR